MSVSWEQRGSLPRSLCSLPLLAMLLGGCADRTLELDVAANPNSVLSAVATVQWKTAPASISITVRTAGAAQQATPAMQIPDGVSSVVIPLLPLRAETTYTLQATGKDASGAEWTSDSVSFTTGTIPAAVPHFTVAAGGTPSPGGTLVARAQLPGSTSPDYLTITDGTGAPLWYYLATPQLGGDFQQQPDGTLTLAIVDEAQTISSLGQPSTVYRQIDMLGNELHLWSARDVPDATPPIVIAATGCHDIRLQPNGDALLFGLTAETMDLTASGGLPNATVVADVLERVTPSGTVTFAWSAFHSLSLANIDPVSTVLNGPVVDFTHGNAIEVMDDGNYLISLRNLSQAIKIDATTGEVLWKLGGADGDFTFLGDPLQRFSCQHGVRELPNGDILLFDDGVGHAPPQSRAAEYRLDTTAMTATLVWSAEDDPPLYAYLLGYAERLPGGNTLITYGETLHVQEVDSSGKVLWDLFDPTGDYGIYRSYRLDPLSPLALVGG